MRLTNSGSFKKFMISYFVILIFPILASALVYNKAIDILEKNAIQSNMNSLNNVKELIEKEVSYVDEEILDLSVRPELKRIIGRESPKEGSPDMYWFYEFHKTYNSIGVAANRNKIFLFIDSNRTVFTENYTNFSFTDFYSDYFTYDNYTYREWYNKYFNHFYYRDYIPAEKIMINGTKREYITGLYTIPIIKNAVTQNKGQGVIAYLYDVADIQTLLGRMVSENQGWAYIVDSKGQTLLSTVPNSPQVLFDESGRQGSFVEQIDGEDYLIVFSKSPSLEWKFISVIPKKVIGESLNQFRYLALGLTAIILLGGMIVAFILSYWNVKSIYEIVELLPDLSLDKLGSKGNELKYIEGEIKTLVTDNYKMKESVSRQHQYLKVMYLERLLRGNLQGEEELEIALKYLDFNEGNFYVGILIKITPLSTITDEKMLQEQDLYRVVLDEVLTEATGAAGHIHILNQNEVALLLELKEEEEHDKKIKELIYKVQYAFRSHFTIQPLFAIGGICDNLLDLHFSLREATYAAEILMLENRKETMIWYRELSHEFKGYYYTDDVEQRITNLTKMGNWSELKLCLKKIYLNTLRNKNADYQMNKILLNDLYATLVKIAYELNVTVDMTKLNNCNRQGNIEKFYKALKEEFEQICHLLCQSKKTHNEQLIEEIVHYIKEDFQNCNLSLALISSKFNLSESYFSQFFKENMNHTFSRYLENMRIRYACELLIEGNRSFEEIAMISGYNNSNTFRRAFRRVTGLSPTDYVKTNQMVEQEV